MYHKTILRALAFTSPLLLLTGCIDDNYDISNADTTSRINVNDLVLPVNIDPVRLGDVIKIDGGKIQPVTIGDQNFYALVQDGSFESEDIQIAGVSAEPTEIEPTVETLDRLVDAQGSRRRAPISDFTYKIVDIEGPFSYNAADIDESIVSLGTIETKPFELRLTLEVADQDNVIKDMTFENLQIIAPKGLVLDGEPSVGHYDSPSGIWEIKRVDVSGNRTEVWLRAKAVDCETAGVVIAKDRSLDFHSQLTLKSGLLHLVPNEGMLPNPDHVTFKISYDLSDFVVKSFSGRIKYDLKGINIDPVNLTDIPDFLKGSETNIDIANPQIYLQINNPVGNVPLNCQAGLRLTTHRQGAPDRVFPGDLDSDHAVIVPIGYAQGAAGPYNFVLSPNQSEDLVKPNMQNVPDFFIDRIAENLEWKEFYDLGQLLKTGKGIPDQISIDVVNAGVPEQRVNQFVIPQTLPKAEGEYQIVAPLALNDGSHVIYTETRDGWSDDDLDKLTITKLELTADAKNNCPVSLDLTVKPLDKEGHELDAEVNSNVLAAGEETELKIELTGEVRNLDGIILRAVLNAGPNAEPLSPEQTLELNNIRVRVSGYYETDF